MALKNLSLEIAIPKGVEVNVVNSSVTVKGPKGTLQKEFFHPKISISVDKSKNLIKIEGKKLNSKEKIIVTTFNSLIENGLIGVSNPYVYELKICSGHFPMKVGIENGRFVIKNLLGEKNPRIVDVPKDVKVNISGDKVVVESSDKELAGQTAADIEKTTLRPGFDKRVFQDGIYIVKKAG
ncbi:50S ribosomal protein L6 [Candidatus Woesearchaeota archaeon]|nr:50S ribosomal protein L6 [Candidatus Woesearchaeota archaeon]